MNRRMCKSRLNIESVPARHRHSNSHAIQRHFQELQILSKSDARVVTTEKLAKPLTCEVYKKTPTRPLNQSLPSGQHDQIPLSVLLLTAVALLAEVPPSWTRSHGKLRLLILSYQSFACFSSTTDPNNLKKLLKQSALSTSTILIS